MGLRWKGPSASTFAAELAASATVTRRESKKKMREAAKKILADSQAGAPVDEHRLEKAHELAIIRLSKDNIDLEISVGGMVDGRQVDDYATRMHEGFYELGDGSKEKAKTSPVPVGRKFLDRAVDRHQEQLINDVANTLPGT